MEIKINAGPAWNYPTLHISVPRVSEVSLPNQGAKAGTGRGGSGRWLSLEVKGGEAGVVSGNVGVGGPAVEVTQQC